MDLQLLDESVALRALWFKRSPDGQLRWRSYNFDFTSTGDDRYQGRIILLGKTNHPHPHTGLPCGGALAKMTAARIRGQMWRDNRSFFPYLLKSKDLTLTIPIDPQWAGF